MPIYCYVVEETGEAFERTFPMKSVREAITVCCADGKWRRAHRDFASEHVSGIVRGNGYPMTSLSLGVHGAKQIAAAEKATAERGVPTKFDERGHAIVMNRDHHRRLLKYAGQVEA